MYACPRSPDLCPFSRDRDFMFRMAANASRGDLFGVRLMGSAAFLDLWRRAGWDYRFALFGIALATVAACAVGVLVMVGDLVLAAALGVGVIVLIPVSNYL